jgi:hypothetical protein
MPETVCGWSPRGTRNITPSFSVQTWFVNPAAIAGVQGRHHLAEPLPVVAIGSASAWRQRAGGHTRL